MWVWIQSKLCLFVRCSNSMLCVVPDISSFRSQSKYHRQLLQVIYDLLATSQLHFFEPVLLYLRHMCTILSDQFCYIFVICVQSSLISPWKSQSMWTFCSAGVTISCHCANVSWYVLHKVFWTWVCLCAVTNIQHCLEDHLVADKMELHSSTQMFLHGHIKGCCISTILRANLTSSWKALFCPGTPN